MTDLHVRGGENPGTLRARYADLEREAAQLAAAGRHLAAVAARAHRALVDPDLLASAALAPHGVARVESAVLLALDGPSGLTELAVEVLAHAATHAATAQAYRAVDDALAELGDLGEWLQGSASAAAEAARDQAQLTGHLVTGDLDAVRHDAPEALGDAQLGLAQVGAGLAWFLDHRVAHVDLPGLAGVVGLVVPDGRTGTARQVVADLPLPRAVPGVEGLLADLRLRDTEAHDRVAEGLAPTVGVRRVVHPDGSAAWVVDVPGTTRWFGRSSTPNDAAGNLHAMAGDDTAYAQAVVDAVTRAAVPPGEPVLVVGHSQGGMVALSVAALLLERGRTVTHVLTAGSPIGHLPDPPGVRVLALENTADVVPLLDGAANRGTRQRTTVSFTEQHGSVTGNHALGVYGRAAHEVDRSDDPSVVAWRSSAQVFVRDDHDRCTQQVYAVERT